MNKITKINLLPCQDIDEEDYLFDKVFEFVKHAVVLLDKGGEQYEHDLPWSEKCFERPKDFLYRVRIGAIGRIKTCRDAIRLGLMLKVPATPNCFVSYGHYLIFRLARQVRREFEYLKELDTYMNNFVNEVNAYSRFMSYQTLMIDDEKK